MSSFSSCPFPLSLIRRWASKAPSFSWVSLRFLDRLLPNAVPSRFLVPIGFTLFTGRSHGSKKRWSCARLRWSLSYRGTQTPIVPQITFRESKGEAYSSISSSRRSVRFYEASKHSSLALINQVPPPLLKVTCCIRHFFHSFPRFIPPISSFLR